MTSIEKIENSIKPLLLTDITFSIENKSIKRGKLILFSIKDFFCVFTLINPDKSTRRLIYEIPYPFNIVETNNSVLFDYTLDSFCLDNTNITTAVSKLKFNKTCKFFNKKVLVQAAI